MNKINRYLAQVVKRTGKYGDFLSVSVNNPSPVKKDGTPDPYHKGTLLWLDAETGKKYIVKQMFVGTPTEAQAAHGTTNQLSIDLNNPYNVDEIE